MGVDSAFIAGKLQFNKRREYHNPYSKVTQTTMYNSFESGILQAKREEKKRMEDPNYLSSFKSR